MTGLFEVDASHHGAPDLPAPDAPPPLEEPPPPSAEDLAFEPMAPDLSLPDPSQEFSSSEPAAEEPPAAPILDDPFAVSEESSTSAEIGSSSEFVADAPQETRADQEFNDVSAETFADPEPVGAIANPVLSTPRAPRASPEWVAAAYPFHLKIFGYLSDLQREELGDLVQSLKLGLNQDDLKLQFESGRVFLPQISEYVGILIIQKIRSWSVEIQFAPADQEQSPSPHTSPLQIKEVRTATPLETLPTTIQTVPDGSKRVRGIGLLHANCVITMEGYLQSQSAEYQRALEFLRREISRQAVILQAQEIWEYKLEPETLPLYKGVRLTATAQAVKTSGSIGGDSVPQSV